MRFITTRREQEIIAYIRALEWRNAELEENALQLEWRNEYLEENRVQLEAAVKDSYELQRLLVEDFIAFRDDPDADLNFDMDEMLLSLTDHIAILGEHFSA